MRRPSDMSREELLALLEDAAKNWLAHDGLWFRGVEEHMGMERAIRLDAWAWEKFSAIEARRIMKRLGMEPSGGIDALVEALGFRLYAHINRQEVVEHRSSKCVFRMNTCRVQEARKRQGLDDFPCKEVGIVEYSVFARTIDPRIRTRCLCCPPDPHTDDYSCAWEFTLQDEHEDISGRNPGGTL